MRIFLCLVLALGVAAIAAPVRAQPSISNSGIRSGAPKAPKGPRAELPPSAVPGAVPRPDSVAPLDHGAADLPPTEALFDAINRGDITSARDALTRGADLDGTNLLGLTPTELSVDLGRNDITFLLLSMRGGGSQPSGAPRQTAEAPPAAAPTAAERRRAQQEARAEAAAASRQAATQKAVQPPRAPALFAGNGGAAVPSVGFLGFDPHH